jgi:hypothetical protein
VNGDGADAWILGWGSDGAEQQCDEGDAGLKTKRHVRPHGLE